jgi:crotonobetainyl-CoA:carnitine CoA-transferase CaiB-like acyl-CoA transferase
MNRERREADCSSIAAPKEMVEDSDVVVENFSPGVMERLGLDYQTLEKINPGIVMTSISNFGQTGPYRDYKSSHLIAWGMAGGRYTDGTPGERPFQIGSWLTHYMAGLHGAAGTACALYQRNKTGSGQHVDVSIWESTILLTTYPTTVYSYRDEIYNRIGRNYLGIFPCRDGHIALNIYTYTHWETLCDFFGMPELRDDPRFQDRVAINEHFDEARAFFAPKVADREKMELFQSGNEWRMPIGLIPTTQEILDFPQHKFRGFFQEFDHPVMGRITMPGAPFKMTKTPWRLRTPAPLLGQHNEEILLGRPGRTGEGPPRPEIGNFPGPESRPNPSGLPLGGIRVTDVTNSWAAPYVTQLLAALGAEVIKVESIQRLDPWRGGAAAGIDEDFWEQSPLFNSVDTDKLSVTLDLTRPEGVEIFKRLVKISDVVAENYTPRVMKNFGLDYPVLKEVNPQIIMLSMPSYGTTGPWRDYSGFAALFEQMSGLPQLTGYPDGPPKNSDWGFADTISGVNGRVAVLVALLFRQMTGKGQFIDLSQVEAATNMIGDAIIEYSMNNKIRPRRGNRHPSMAPHGYYRCKGEDSWVGIAVSSDEEWLRFGKAIGDPPWTKEKRFAGSIDRLQHQDALDALVEAWTVRHEHYEVMHALQKAGIAAGIIPSPRELLADPHLKVRGTFQIIDRDIVGPHPYTTPLASMRLSKTPRVIRRPAPLLGEHNDYVLGVLLGMSKQEIQSLADDRVIGTVPLDVEEVQED